MSDSAVRQGPLDRIFGLSSAGSTVSRELRAGLTTFVTMAYILFVNPSILGDAITTDGNTFGQLLTATAIAAAVGTLMMGVVARYPFALAPGMGLNAYFAYTVVLGQGVAWQTALGAVFISGALFLALSLVGIREAIINAIPIDVRRATVVGIGLFLAFIGLQNAGLVVASPATLVQLGEVTASGPLIAVAGILVTAVLLQRKLPGAVLIGIATSTVLAIVTAAPVYQGEPFPGFVDGVVASPVWPTDLFLELDIGAAIGLGLLDIVFIFVFVDLFDTAGTLIGLSSKAGVLDEEGRLPRAGLAFSADAVATMVGALVGTSTTTSYIESAAGIEEGGRTGLTAVFAAICFALAIFLWPLAAAVPAVATAPALVVVGALMLTDVGRIRWADPVVAIPAFLTMIMMPLTFSIATGISFGIIARSLLSLFSPRHRRQSSWLLHVLAALLVARYVWLGGG